ncbi:MAG: DUF1592 domain-containing protein [Vicinamibacterales bacterium]
MAASSVEAQNSVIKQYCVVCHNDKAKIGGLTLAAFDATHAAEAAETSEKIILKLRAGMMPPAGVKRPDAGTLASLAQSLETRIDQAAALQPNPGRRPFQRLNRAEYARSIRELLDIEVDVEAFLPPDTVSHSFDNIADMQVFSPTLLEGYLRAAHRISLVAMGDRHAGPREATYKVPRTASQMVHVVGTPLGTRGGIAVVHNFPADGEYRFKLMLHATLGGVVFGSTALGEQIVVSVGGDEVARLDVDPRMSEVDKAGLTIETAAIAIKAGPQHVSAAFISRVDGPVDDLMAPIDHTLADAQIGDAYGITVLPHLRDLGIVGPHAVTGISATPSRRKILTCRPASPQEETPCARAIATTLASEAYRRPATAEDVKELMRFYQAGRTGHDFESGVRMVVEAVLASPDFVFRLEGQPAAVRAGQNYRIADIDLASRLAYFLWAVGPDRELIELASRRRLSDPAVLQQQIRRMLADPRAEALATRFASQWLRLQDLERMHPDALLFPQYDQRLGAAMRRETELLFDSIVREDRNVLDLLTADYTFVNERLARHYGIPNVGAGGFKRVEIADEHRRGILGHGSVLTMTSVPDRTSPVQRGKWILEVLLGSPPPPPPPNVPALEDIEPVTGTRTLSVRERMEEHRKNPACVSCHRVIDPLGLALENFDVTGVWRVRDNGVPVDASGTLYDGTEMNGPVALRQALLNRSEVILQTFTKSLMAYGLGRRIESYDMPTVRAITRAAAEQDNRFSSFVLGIVGSPAFQMSRAEGPRPATTASPLR